MTTQYLRSDDHVYRQIAGEDMLVALRRSAVSPLFELTASAVLLWQRLSAWCTADELTDALLAAFEVDRETAAADVEQFVEQLRSVGALQIREKV